MIRDILTKLGIKIAPERHHHVTTGWVGIDCPFCSPDSGRYRLGINERSGASNCWSCGGISTSKAVAAAAGISEGEAAKLLKSSAPKTLTKKHKVKGKLVLPNPIGKLLTPHKNYLESRGFDPSTIEKLWSVKGIAVSIPRWAWRLYVPIHEDGEQVSWMLRTLHNRDTRYTGAAAEQEVVSKKEVLYGIDYVRNSAVVVEGVTDAWRIGPGAVATFGISFTKTQVLKIARIPKRAILFDREPDAERAARRLYKTLLSYPGETFLLAIDADDPGSATEQEVQSIRKVFLDEQ